MVKELLFINMNRFKAEKSVLETYLKDSLDKIEFRKVYFGYAKPLPSFSIPLDFFSRITIPLYGKSVITAAFDGVISDIEFLPGDILFTGENGWARRTPEKASAASISVVFMKSYIRVVYSERKKGINIYNPWYHTSKPPGEISLNLINALNRIMLETDSDRQSRALPIIKALVCQVLQELENDSESKLTRSEKTLMLLKDYIQQNYHLPINRSAICNDLKLNQCYVSRLFHEKTGEHLISHINSLRMKKAAFVLRNYNISIEEAADQCGFTSAGYFIKAFRKSYGITPGEYRSTAK